MAAVDVVVLDRLPHLGRLIARAVPQGAARDLGRKLTHGLPGQLPSRILVVPDHPQDAAQLAAYDRLCGFPVADAVPPTWLHVLAFPLQVALMASPDFPFALAGLVHLANDMTLHRPVSLRDRLRLQVSADSLAGHRRGHRFDLVGEVYVGDQLAWSGRSTYLARDPDAHAAASPGARRGGRDKREAPVPSEDGRDGRGGRGAPGDGREGRDWRGASGLPSPSQVWRLPADLGRRYAAVSGDVNPLHLYPLTARAFGFRRPIVHGMWTHARALAALGGRLPATYGVGVRFTKPILLPGSVSYGVERTASGWRFAVSDSEGARPYLLGEVTS